MHWKSGNCLKVFSSRLSWSRHMVCPVARDRLASAPRRQRVGLDSFSAAGDQLWALCNLQSWLNVLYWVPRDLASFARRSPSTGVDHNCFRPLQTARSWLNDRRVRIGNEGRMDRPTRRGIRCNGVADGNPGPGG